MDNHKLKHLEFIQNIITRMNSNSFLIKGWTITLVSALYALAAKDSNSFYVLITYIPIPIFWILDGFYISQERQYRDLYSQITETNENDIDFSLDASSFDNGRNTWLNGIASKTLIPFYGIALVVTIVAMYIIN